MTSRFFARVGATSAPCGEKNQSWGLSTGGGEEASVWREERDEDGNPLAQNHGIGQGASPET